MENTVNSEELNNINIMDIASQEVTDEQLSNIETLVGSKQSYESLNTPIRYNNRKPLVRIHEKIRRNELCPCGSGKKYKNCCLKTGEYEGLTH